MKQLLIIIALVLLSAEFYSYKHPVSIPKTSNTISEVVVSRVIDGDTIALTDGRRVRYIGMDTPEVVDPQKPVECYGQEAKEENKRLIDGKTVRLEKDVSETDSYGRLLRYVYVDGIMINEYLVRQGFAHASTFPPDVRYQDRLLVAEREAKAQGRGLWGSCET